MVVIMRESSPAGESGVLFAGLGIAVFFFSSRRRHTRSLCDWSSDVCSSDLVDDGTQNFAGALRSALGVCGARDIAEFHHAELVIAPAITSEGKVYQSAQHVGMRSEERRVGKECRSRWGTCRVRKNRSERVNH